MSKLKKILSILLSIIIVSNIVAIFTFVSAVSVFDITTADDLYAAVSTINTDGPGEYILNLQNDISINGINFSGAGVEVTIIGNNHSLTVT